MRPATGAVDAALDLVLGSACVGCGRAGRALCRSCAAALPTRPTRVSLDGVADGRAWAAAAYDGAVRHAVLGLKERGRLGLARPLGALLAGAVAAAAGPTRVPVVLVPVPSRPAAIRSRGHDSTTAIARRAAAVLSRATDVDRSVTVAGLLRTRPGVTDQAGLDRAGRAANLAGALTCPSPGLARLARRTPSARVVICDDVITTGATVREAQRALSAVGLRISGVAAVAATPLPS